MRAPFYSQLAAEILNRELLANPLPMTGENQVIVTAAEPAQGSST